jgi:hypothetical protein
VFSSTTLAIDGTTDITFLYRQRRHDRGVSRWHQLDGHQMPPSPARSPLFCCEYGGYIGREKTAQLKAAVICSGNYPWIEVAISWGFREGEVGASLLQLHTPKK